MRRFSFLATSFLAFFSLHFLAFGHFRWPVGFCLDQQCRKWDRTIRVHSISRSGSGSTERRLARLRGLQRRLGLGQPVSHRALRMHRRGELRGDVREVRVQIGAAREQLW